MRSRFLDFGPGGHPSHAYLLPPSRNKYIIKSHLTLIRFPASGVPISRSSHLMIIIKKRVYNQCNMFEDVLRECFVK